MSWILLSACSLSVACGGAQLKEQSALESTVLKSMPPKTQANKSSASDSRLRHLRKLYVAEGQRSAPSSCAELNEPDSDEILARYFAYTRGSKAIVKEHCVSDLLAELPPLPQGECTGAGCRYHDTYRRGPIYFVRMFVVFEALSLFV
jgi:hypothetical protein